MFGDIPTAPGAQLPDGEMHGLSSVEVALIKSPRRCDKLVATLVASG